jgi:oligopeptide transport system substrate-binding protein
MSSERLKIFIYSILLVISLFLTSCTPYKKGISINIQAPPMTLDPRRACVFRDVNLIRTFNEGLFRIDRSGTNAKAIAEICFLSQDQKTYVITLKKTFWSNGDPLTSHDFVNAWKSSLNAENPSPNAALFFPIKNAEAVKNGTMDPDKLGVYASDDYSLVIELERPTPYFTELLSLPNFFPIHKSIEEGELIWINNKAEYICNGPFSIHSWEQNKRILAKKNPYYWDKDSVKTEQLTLVMVNPKTAFNLFKSHQLDWIGAPYSHIPMDKISASTKNKLLNRKCLNATYLIRLNTEEFPLNNKLFRNSLAHGINRKDLVDYVLDFTAEIATSFVPPSMLVNKAAFIEDGNVLKAQYFLDQSLLELGITKNALPVLKLIYPEKERKRKIALAVQDSLRKTLNISIELEPVDLKDYIKRIHNKDYQLALGGWSAEYRDPISFLDVFKTKSNGSNNTGWESQEYINALENSYLCTNHMKRMERLVEAETILLTDMPLIPLYHSSMLNLSDENLQDLILLETGAIDFKWAYLKR